MPELHEAGMHPFGMFVGDIVARKIALKLIVVAMHPRPFRLNVVAMHPPFNLAWRHTSLLAHVFIPR